MKPCNQSALRSTKKKKKKKKNCGDTAEAAPISKKKKRRVESEDQSAHRSTKKNKNCGDTAEAAAKENRIVELGEYNMKSCSQSSTKKKKKNCDFLFSEEIGREYVVRYGGGGGGDDSESRVVGIEILRGKHVGILFTIEPTRARAKYRVLQQVYKEIRDKHGDVFEILFVATMDVKDDEYEKRNLPFLAVPFVDFKWRERLCNEYFGVKNLFNQTIYLCLFDPQGRPLKDKCKTGMSKLGALIQEFGSAFYPFTVAREMQLIKEGEAAMRSKSLQVILGGDYVISNDGHTKVPISQLRDSVVGLFFYDNRRLLSSYKQLLLNIYNQLKEGHYKFEIIFVNVSYRNGYTDEQTFLRKLKDMPWLALPFNDQRVWRLYSMLTPGEDDAYLTIIGPSHNPFVEIRGFHFIKEWGIEAYPFSEDGAVNAIIERLRKLKLADFLEGMGVEYLLCKKKRRTSTIQLSSFRQQDNNQVLLYISSWSSDEDQDPPHKSKETSRLLDMYLKLNQSFKVVFLSIDFDKTSFAEHFNTMPPSWFAIPFKKRNMYYDNERIWSDFPHLIAFDGSSGCLLKMGSLESFGTDGADAFPFITDQHFFELIRETLPFCLSPV